MFSNREIILFIYGGTWIICSWIIFFIIKLQDKRKKNKMSKTVRHLWINQDMYLIPRSSIDIKKAIVDLFLGIESNDGIITFDSKKYKIEQMELFERFLITWLMGYKGEQCDPEIENESEIPVELRFPKEQHKTKIKEFLHDKK